MLRERVQHGALAPHRALDVARDRVGAVLPPDRPGTAPPVLGQRIAEEAAVPIGVLAVPRVAPPAGPLQTVASLARRTIVRPRHRRRVGAGPFRAEHAHCAGDRAPVAGLLAGPL